MRHLFRGRNDDKTAFFAEQWARHLKGKLPPDVETRGPAPAPIEKMKGRYRFHLWYFTESVTRLVPVLAELREAFPLDKDVVEILDVDPVNLG